MPPRMATTLERLRQDLADCLSPDAIRAACRSAGHRWRERLLDPVTTVYLFLLQVLHGNTACQHVVHFGGWSFSASAYCQARRRLPLAVWQHLLDRTSGALRQTSDGARWLGHRVWLLDGSSFSMPDAPELRKHFGQPAAQKPGCGFPVAHLMVWVDVATGMLLRAAATPLRTHDSKAAQDAPALEPGDVVVGDRGLCSFARLARLAARGVYAVFRVHQRVRVDFTPGRDHVRPEQYLNPRGLPRSRWVCSLGEQDQIVEWYKPGERPGWMTAEEFAALPEVLRVRELRYKVAAAGFRTREVTLATTLLDAAAYTAEALAGLYRLRWRIETWIRHLKITMKMDILRCETVAGVQKELAAFALVYNLVRSVMWETARRRGVSPERVGFVDALRWLGGCDSGHDGHGATLWINPDRPGRAEPRVRKRRPKQWPRMMAPRAELRKRLRDNEDAA
jgi:hypothetical protein